MNTTARSTAAPPMPPNCAAICRGSATSMTEFGSPTVPHAGSPDFSTSYGLAPNVAGAQSTMSAIRPGGSVPTSCERPCAIAGLIVSLAR